MLGCADGCGARTIFGGRKTCLRRRSSSAVVAPRRNPHEMLHRKMRARFPVQRRGWWRMARDPGTPQAVTLGHMRQAIGTCASDALQNRPGSRDVEAPCYPPTELTRAGLS
jgi:hypothetical protein